MNEELMTAILALYKMKLSEVEHGAITNQAAMIIKSKEIEQLQQELAAKNEMIVALNNELSELQALNAVK